VSTRGNPAIYTAFVPVVLAWFGAARRRSRSRDPRAPSRRAKGADSAPACTYNPAPDSVKLFLGSKSTHLLLLFVPHRYRDFPRGVPSSGFVLHDPPGLLNLNLSLDLVFDRPRHPSHRPYIFYFSASTQCFPFLVNGNISVHP
jgi:hypothetical protein